MPVGISTFNCLCLSHIPIISLIECFKKHNALYMITFSLKLHSVPGLHLSAQSLYLPRSCAFLQSIIKLNFLSRATNISVTFALFSCILNCGISVSLVARVGRLRFELRTERPMKTSTVFLLCSDRLSVSQTYLY